jgi:hypothetical protein
MNMGFTSAFRQPEDWTMFRPGRGSRVLLREPERCPECNRVFISLYPLRVCEDHEGLDEL